MASHLRDPGTQDCLNCFGHKNEATIAPRTPENLKVNVCPSRCKFSTTPEQISNVESWEPLPAQHVGGIPEINHISQDQDGRSWEEIEITVDSGAAATVMPPEMCTYVPIDKNSNAHTKFRAANGSIMQNEGMRALKGIDENFNPMGSTPTLQESTNFLRQSAS